MKIRTEAVVGVAAFVGLLTYVWHFLPPMWASVATLAAVWETVALASGMPTISEVVWEASDRYSLVPWVGGFMTGLAVGSGYMHDPYVLAPVLLIEGHFWFPRYDNAAWKAVRDRRIG